MKKLTCSFPAKVAAVFFLVLTALGTAGSGFLVAVAYDFHFYRVSSGMDFTQAIAELQRTAYLSRYDADMILRHDALFQIIMDMRYSSIVLCLLFLLLFILLFLFLLCAAGRREGREGVYLGVVDRVPLDLTAAAAVGVTALLCQICVESTYSGDPVLDVLAVSLTGILVLLTLLSVVYTFAARVKAGKWWRNTLIWRTLGLLWRLLRGAGRFLLRLFLAIRMEWRVALLTLVSLAILYITPILIYQGNDIGIGMFLLYPAAFAVCVLGAWQFGKLRRAGEKLAAGELDYKLDTARMFFDFKRHGENLNSIGDGMSAAVDQRMRSERLKTELITNVSHDIKTPLTSIVNYVDLLQKAHTPQEEQQYLEVLSRQSEKLRRLTVDLVEASKASTGNLPTELAPTNTEELIHQAVAEYADRFREGRLEPVITLPDAVITVLADGRHLWRVLDNLFNNAVKYAQPGTRVYIDAKRLDGQAVLSVKNISRDRLNVSSEELMERFVRGDQSRHTEGSGLGLSIARSLTELMGGKFQILIDGDLFKAEIWLKLL